MTPFDYADWLDQRISEEKRNVSKNQNDGISFFRMVAELEEYITVLGGRENAHKVRQIQRAIRAIDALKEVIEFD
jgi:hypothetical protein